MAKKRISQLLAGVFAVDSKFEIETVDGHSRYVTGQQILDAILEADRIIDAGGLSFVHPFDALLGVLQDVALYLEVNIDSLVAAVGTQMAVALYIELDLEASSTLGFLANNDIALNLVVNPISTHTVGLNTTITTYEQFEFTNSDSLGVSLSALVQLVTPDEVDLVASALLGVQFAATGINFERDLAATTISLGLTENVTLTREIYMSASASVGIQQNSAVAVPTSIFAAVALDGSVMTSPDGITWTSRTAAEANGWAAICWSPSLSLFAAVALSGTNRVMTSPDGVNWTARSAAEANSWRGVAWSPTLSLFAAVSTDGTHRAMTSPDGITWTARTMPSGGWTGICWSDTLGLFVASDGSTDNQFATSSDGITWTSRTGATASRSYIHIAWSNALGILVAVSSDEVTAASAAASSTNATSWTARSTVNNNAWRAVAWSPPLGIFAAVALDGATQCISSTNGTSWTGRSAAAAKTWRGICWGTGPAVFVAVSGDGAVMTSANGTSWTSRTAASAATWIGVAFSE